MQSDCIFCKIIAGEIPSYKIYENDYTCAFLDIRPLHPGHTLIIPKKHEDHLYDLDNINYTELMDVIKILAPAIKEATWATRVGLVVEGLEVPHAHIHLVPINRLWDLDSTHRKTIDKKNMEKVQEEIISHIE